MMIVQKIINAENKEVGKIQLKDEVFGAKPKKHLLRDVVVMQLACRRSGNASTKIRSEVRGGGAKPFRQKGTGFARQGTIRSPILKGGGVTFGPRKRSYSYSLPKKVRRAALKTSLILKRNDKKLFIFENLNLKKHKTKEATNFFKRFKINNALVVDGDNKNLMLAVRNIPGFKFIKPEGLNVYDVLKYENLVMTKYSMEKIEEDLIR